MTLLATKPALESSLLSFFDAVPSTEAECAALWGDAMRTYFAGMSPVSGALSAAVAAFSSSLSGMSSPGAALTLFPSAFTALGSALALGLPQTPTPAQPPIGTPVFPLATESADVDKAAQEIANNIHAWATTGKYAGGLPWI